MYTRNYFGISSVNVSNRRTTKLPGDISVGKTTVLIHETTSMAIKKVTSNQLVQDQDRKK